MEIGWADVGGGGGYILVSIKITMIIEEGTQKANYFAVNVGSCKRLLSYFKTLIQSILKQENQEGENVKVCAE